MTASHVYSSLAADPDLGELVEMFVDEMPSRISALETQAQSGDWPQLTRTAHQLKGAAGSYGFAAITPSAARLESAAREGCHQEEILLALRDLLDLCRRVRGDRPQREEVDDSSIGSDFQ
jgi:histidine phosphotransfer protein HptB